MKTTTISALVLTIVTAASAAPKPPPSAKGPTKPPAAGVVKPSTAKASTHVAKATGTTKPDAAGQTGNAKLSGSSKPGAAATPSHSGKPGATGTAGSAGAGASPSAAPGAAGGVNQKNSGGKCGFNRGGQAALGGGPNAKKKSSTGSGALAANAAPTGAGAGSKTPAAAGKNVNASHSAKGGASNKLPAGNPTAAPTKQPGAKTKRWAIPDDIPEPTPTPTVSPRSITVHELSTRDVSSASSAMLAIRSMTAGMEAKDASLLSDALHIEGNITTSTSHATVVPTIRARDPADIVISINETTPVTTTVVNEAGPTTVAFSQRFSSGGESEAHVEEGSGEGFSGRGFTERNHGVGKRAELTDNHDGDGGVERRRICSPLQPFCDSKPPPGSFGNNGDDVRPPDAGEDMASSTEDTSSSTTTLLPPPTSVDTPPAETTTSISADKAGTPTPLSAVEDSGSAMGEMFGIGGSGESSPMPTTTPPPDSPPYPMPGGDPAAVSAASGTLGVLERRSVDCDLASFQNRGNPRMVMELWSQCRESFAASVAAEQGSSTTESPTSTAMAVETLSTTSAGESAAPYTIPGGGPSVTYAASGTAGTVGVVMRRQAIESAPAETGLTADVTAPTNEAAALEVASSLETTAPAVPNPAIDLEVPGDPDVDGPASAGAADSAFPLTSTDSAILTAGLSGASADPAFTTTPPAVPDPAIDAAAPGAPEISDSTPAPAVDPALPLTPADSIIPPADPASATTPASPDTPGTDPAARLEITPDEAAPGVLLPEDSTESLPTASIEADIQRGADIPPTEDPSTEFPTEEIPLEKTTPAETPPEEAAPAAPNDGNAPPYPMPGGDPEANMLVGGTTGAVLRRQAAVTGSGLLFHRMAAVTAGSAGLVPAPMPTGSPVEMALGQTPAPTVSDILLAPTEVALEADPGANVRPIFKRSPMHLEDYTNVPGSSAVEVDPAVQQYLKSSFSSLYWQTRVPGFCSGADCGIKIKKHCHRLVSYAYEHRCSHAMVQRMIDAAGLNHTALPPQQYSDGQTGPKNKRGTDWKVEIFLEEGFKLVKSHDSLKEVEKTMDTIVEALARYAYSQGVSQLMFNFLMRTAGLDRKAPKRGPKPPPPKFENGSVFNTPDHPLNTMMRRDLSPAPNALEEAVGTPSSSSQSTKHIEAYLEETFKLMVKYKKDIPNIEGDMNGVVKALCVDWAYPLGVLQGTVQHLVRGAKLSLNAPASSDPSYGSIGETDARYSNSNFESHEPSIRSTWTAKVSEPVLPGIRPTNLAGREVIDLDGYLPSKRNSDGNGTVHSLVGVKRTPIKTKEQKAEEERDGNGRSPYGGSTAEESSGPVHGITKRSPGIGKQTVKNCLKKVKGKCVKHAKPKGQTTQPRISNPVENKNLGQGATIGSKPPGAGGASQPGVSGGSAAGAAGGQGPSSGQTPASGKASGSGGASGAGLSSGDGQIPGSQGGNHGSSPYPIEGDGASGNTQFEEDQMSEVGSECTSHPSGSECSDVSSGAADVGSPSDITFPANVLTGGNSGGPSGGGPRSDRHNSDSYSPYAGSRGLRPGSSDRQRTGPDVGPDHHLYKRRPGKPTGGGGSTGPKSSSTLPTHRKPTIPGQTATSPKAKTSSAERFTVAQVMAMYCIPMEANSAGKRAETETRTCMFPKSNTAGAGGKPGLLSAGNRDKLTHVAKTGFGKAEEAGAVGKAQELAKDRLGGLFGSRNARRDDASAQLSDALYPRRDSGVALPSDGIEARQGKGAAQPTGAPYLRRDIGSARPTDALKARQEGGLAQPTGIQVRQGPWAAGASGAPMRRQVGAAQASGVLNPADASTPSTLVVRRSPVPTAPSAEPSVKRYKTTVYRRE